MKKSVIATFVAAALASWGVQAAEVNLADDVYEGKTVTESSAVASGAGYKPAADSTVTMAGTQFKGNTVEATGATNAAQGGGYYQMGGTLDASDIKVTDNTAKGTIVNGAGMVLFNVNGSIDGATFTGNTGEITGQTTASGYTSEAYGGALSIQRWKSEDELAFKVSNSTFSNNTLTGDVEGNSTYGAAIYLQGGEQGMDVTLDGITATENTAGKGGAIGVYDASITMSGSVIEKNKATDGEGGAIFAETFSSEQNTVSITDSSFTGNSAERADGLARGGAIYIGSTKGGKTQTTLTGVDLIDNTVSNVGTTNKAAQGGGFFQFGGSVKADGLTVTGNTAESDYQANGGGMMIFNADGSIANSQFSGNTADGAKNSYGGGLALMLYGSSAPESMTFTISQTTFDQNKATGEGTDSVGGGLMVQGLADGSKSVDLTVEGSTFSGNEAVNGWGGGAFLAQVNGTLTKTVFEGNKATDGGAIYNFVMDPEGSETGLTITDSTFTGNVATTGEGGAIRNGDNATLAFTGTNVFTGNTAQEKPNDIFSSGLVDVVSGETTLNGGIVSEGDKASVNISENAVLGLGGVSNINKLTGTNGTMKIVDAAADVTVGVNEAKSLTLAGTGDVNDALKGNAAALADIVTFEGENAEDIALFMQEGMYEGETTGILGADGTVKSVTTKTNTLMQSTLELASVAPLAMNRIMMSDLRKRMGDIRTDTGVNGAWARYEGGRLSGSNGLENDFNTIQVGADTKLGDWRVGGAFNYTKGDADYARGDADMDAYGLSAYGLWLGEQGQFVDIVARVSKADTDMTVDGYKTGSMDSMAYSLSGEFGWRFALSDMVYVEPQVEAAYTYVDADDADIGTASYKFDSVNSFIGRAGFAAGLKCPDNFGDVYFHASALHEFAGDSEITGGNGSKYKIDGDDTWFEYGIGANFNINKATYVWADVQRTSGADLDEDWRANVGVRYSF